MPSVELSSAEEQLVLSVRDLVETARAESLEKVPAVEEVREDAHTAGVTVGWVASITWLTQQMVDVRRDLIQSDKYVDIRALDVVDTLLSDKLREVQ